MIKKIFLLLAIMLTVLGVAFADDLAEARKLIDAKTPCQDLTESQLEMIGDYYMEQMHPGESHQYMEEAMGGEGSERLRLMHIAIAKKIYCNDLDSPINYGFLGMGQGYGRGMMYGLAGDDAVWPMMRGYGTTYYGGGMMPYIYTVIDYGHWFAYLFWLLLLISAILWAIYLLRARSRDPLTILKMRYAKGEITKKEFLGMKKEVS